MLKATKERVDQSIALLASLGEVRSRAQFGGFSLSLRGSMFALVAEGELYLRAAQDNENMMRALMMPQFVYYKRGMEILLRYFRVDETLWQHPDQLIALADESIRGMESEKAARKSQPRRLKDLPNINLTLERTLWQVGVKDAAELRVQGAIGTYVKICALKKETGLNTLLALEGAILGFHKSVLPTQSHAMLLNWFNSFQQDDCRISA